MMLRWYEKAVARRRGRGADGADGGDHDAAAPWNADMADREAAGGLRRRSVGE
jgi:hypothetical protein